VTVLLGLWEPPARLQAVCLPAGEEGAAACASGAARPTSPSYVHLHPACHRLWVYTEECGTCALLSGPLRAPCAALARGVLRCDCMRKDGSERAPPSAHPCEPGLPVWAAEGACRTQEAAKAQQELAEAEFDGYSSDETVRVVMSGNQEPKSVDITEEAIAGGPEARPAFTRTLSSTSCEGCCRVSRKCVLRCTSQACASGLRTPQPQHDARQYGRNHAQQSSFLPGWSTSVPCIFMSACIALE